MEDFIEGLGIAQNKLAVSVGDPPRRINEIVHGTRGITADTALTLAKYFGTSQEFWMNLQSQYELRIERGALQDQLANVRPLMLHESFALEDDPGRFDRSGRLALARPRTAPIHAV